MKKALFIDRDGTLIVEPDTDYQIDTLEKLEFMPAVFRNLYFIRQNLEMELVIVSNQDGLGTPSYPEECFTRVQDKMLRAFRNEGVEFDDILIDRSFPEERLPTRKPEIGMMGKYRSGDYDLSACWMIGDRITDIRFAANMGCRAIFYCDPGRGRIQLEEAGLTEVCGLITDDWNRIYEFLATGERTASVIRKTAETDIAVHLKLDGTGQCEIDTGIGFFDHMLTQIGRHSGMNLSIRVKGDLWVDEHHTVEDTALALGEAIHRALGNKRGIERYGFMLPMDDSLCRIALDFGGRPWLVWKTEFKREKIGEMPTEMFYHFFRSLSEAARMNLWIEAEGGNEHHKIEGIFKAFARALKAAVRRDVFRNELPSSKGVIF